MAEWRSSSAQQAVLPRRFREGAPSRRTGAGHFVNASEDPARRIIGKLIHTKRECPRGHLRSHTVHRSRDSMDGTTAGARGPALCDRAEAIRRRCRRAWNSRDTAEGARSHERDASGAELVGNAAGAVAALRGVRVPSATPIGRTVCPVRDRRQSLDLAQRAHLPGAGTAGDRLGELRLVRSILGPAHIPRLVAPARQPRSASPTRTCRRLRHRATSR